MNRKEFIKGIGLVAGATAFGSRVKAACPAPCACGTGGGAAGTLPGRVLGSGRAAMSVSTLGFGCMGLTYNRSQHPDKQQMKRLLARAVDEDDGVAGLYILHPNNVGRCGHIANASYVVRSDCRGCHIGEKLVLDCLAQAKAHGFGILQFNAVVEGNVHARHLYERLGFSQLGTIPRGFRMKDGTFANICPYYRETNVESKQ